MAQVDIVLYSMGSSKVSLSPWTGRRFTLLGAGIVAPTGWSSLWIAGPGAMV